MKRKITVFMVVAKCNFGDVCLTALAAKADRTGLIGAECSCIHNFSRTRQIESEEDRGASVRSVKSAFTIYEFPLYLLTFPVYNSPTTQVIIDAVNKARLSESTVHVTTTLGSVNLEYFFWRVSDNVKGNYCGAAPNISGIHER
ncbi:hypothetical protein FQA39_LY05182 [Lamprigera yunnana]|nr:hypothetical protein FQA39_LY05182 [Lamprigera yunnana]